MRFFRAAAVAAGLSVLLPGMVTAQCAGTSLMDRLSPEQRAEVASAAAATPHGEGLIWQASRGDSRITIVGTMHVSDPRMPPLFEAAAAELAVVDRVLFEVTPEEQAQLMRAMTDDPSLTVITEGPTLPELLDPPTWDALRDAASERGIPGFMAAKMQPWFLAVSLSMPPCAMEAMAAGEQGLDFLLMDRAEELGIPMQALEPWDTLFSLFDAATMDDQIELLRLSLIAPEVQDEMFVAMLDGYFEGRIAELWELNRVAFDFMPEAPEGAAFFDKTEQLLIRDRNHAWIPVIEAAAAGDDHIMVAAGAAHMPGTDGVLRLLEDRGWTVTRLR
jgi:uncharacterized protein YbaP (TraB family)